MPTVAWSEFWGPSVGAYSFSSIKNPNRMRIKRALSGEGVATTVELFDKTLGAAPGATATVTRKRMQHNPDQSLGATGGKPVVETVTLINRATTAADVTALKEMTTPVATRPTYPRDKSGNGGPAF